jgi:aldehyde:ferredoxin oxidoreductase
MCGQGDAEAINMANDICNRAGLDTISAGTVVAFAIECYENGILTKRDTGGIDLKWGDHQAMVAMTEKLARNEGLGAILAQGVKRAAEKIGRGAEKFAVHVGGQEVGMHDPKLAGFGGWESSARYQMDATPGRHTQGFGPNSFRGHAVNSLGVCVFGFGFGDTPEGNARLMQMINGVTGWNASMDDILKAGERVANLRHAFNLREGVNEIEWYMHPRIVGRPPLKAGPLTSVTTDVEAQIMWNLGALDWDHATTKPSKAKLLSLGLDDVARDLWPDKPRPPR